MSQRGRAAVLQHSGFKDLRLSEGLKPSLFLLSPPFQNQNSEGGTFKQDFILFYFILFYFILFYFILFYMTPGMRLDCESGLHCLTLNIFVQRV